MKLLVDECLSPELVHMARERGHGESSHVVWIGHQGIKDWDLLKIVLEGDWTCNPQRLRLSWAGGGTGNARPVSAS